MIAAPRDADQGETSRHSPRWGEGDEDQTDVERGHPFRDEHAPSQVGVIDRQDGVERGGRHEGQDDAMGGGPEAVRTGGTDDGRPPRTR